MTPVLNGIDRIDLWKPLLKGKRIGVMTHAPAVTLDYTRSVDLLCKHLNVTTLWGPEHGLDGVAQAGAEVKDSIDSRTNLPVYSLFGSSEKTFAEAVRETDCVVCDFCDIGSRFYTYIYSMSDAMTECAKQHIPFYVMDRPNPINGVNCNGTLLEEKNASFLGRFPIPARHGMTIGEIARLFNERFGIHCNLTVIPVSGWRRNMEFEDFGRVWINPSPNMTSADCARLYSGTCFLEGTNVAEGRGTTRPYEIIGAPYLDSVRLAKAFNSFHQAGITAYPCRFVPTFSKYAQEPCDGVQFILTDRKKANCFEAGIRLLEILRNDYSAFAYSDTTLFDHLMGSDLFRTGKVTADEWIQKGREDSCAFLKERSDSLLYKA